MYGEDKNADPRVTLIDPDKNYHTIHDFYGKKQYGKDGKLGIYHKDFPDSLDSFDQADFVGWKIVVTEQAAFSSDETETKSGKVVDCESRSDGWFIQYEQTP